MAEPTTTLGRLLVEKAIPEDMRDRERIFNKKSTTDFFQELAERHPEEYVDVLQRLNDISRVSATEYGGSASLRLSDLRLPPRTKAYRKELRLKVHAISQDPRLSADQKQTKIVHLIKNAMPTIQSMLMKEVGERDNAYGLGVSQGFRGSPTQLTQMMFGDMLVADHRGRPVPIPGLHGYGEGVTPAEYWAGSYGSRKGYCLALGTLVRMADMSLLSIENIEVGMQVLGSDMSGGTFPVTVLRTWENGLKEIWAYSFRVGRAKATKVLRSTEAHKILGLYKDGGRDSLREIQKRPVGKARRTFGAWPAAGFCPGTVDEPLAYTYGQLLGDGCFGEMSVTLTSADERAVESVQKEMLEAGFELRPIPRNRRSGMPSYEYRAVDPSRSRFGPNAFKDMLRKFGFVWVKAPDKTIPDGVYKLSEKSLFSFIEGYFEADGSVGISGDKTDVPLIRFHSSSRQLLNSLRDILESRLGVYCAGMAERKAEDMAGSMSYGYAIQAVEDAYSLRISHRDSVQRLVSGFLGRGSKSATAIDMASKMTSSSRDERLVFAFKEKEFVGVLPSFDLEVDHPDHLFVLGNGIVVSNSDVQFATAKTGFLGKQLTAMSQHATVTGEDCGAKDVGILVDGEDPEIIGSVLAREIQGIPQGTVITKKHLPKIKDKKPLVRSLLTCQQPEGICQQCAGQRDQGNFPAMGSYVGVDVGRVVSEPMTQELALSAKHTGGVVGVNSDNVEGFEEVNQFVQIPKMFRGAAALAPVSGRVRQIVKAPQGGHYLFVDEAQIHIPEGRKIKVSPGDEVEAGDVLTSGTPNPADIAQYKGLGEGRKYFQDKFYEILKENGVPTHRRNVEVLAKSFFDRVQITEPDGLQGYIIGDIVPYGALQKEYKPRQGAQALSPKRGVGQYLERPVLHYSIGTKITPKIAKFLAQEGVESVVAHKNQPGFEPHVTRLMGIPAEDPDWKIRLAGFGIKRSLLEAARHGSESKHEQTSAIPKIMDPSRL